MDTNQQNVQQLTFHLCTSLLVQRGGYALHHKRGRWVITGLWSCRGTVFPSLTSQHRCYQTLLFARLSAEWHRPGGAIQAERILCALPDRCFRVTWSWRLIFS